MQTLKLMTFMTFTILSAILYLIIAFILFPWHKKIGPLILQQYSRIALKILRVHVDCADSIPLQDTGNKGIILTANHVSLLDILLMSALYRSIYLSKEEVRHYPLIGLVARLIGIIFLKRESPMDGHRVLKTIARQVVNGRIITIFPQGTTGAIADRLPFKRGIFKAVEINPDAVLLPVTIRYKEDSDIAWRRHQILLDNLKAICAQKGIHVKVTIHEPMSIKDYTDKTVSEICAVAQEKVLSLLWAEY